MPDFGIYAGDTSKTIYVRLRDSTTGLAKTALVFNSTGASATYVLPGAAVATITLATLASASAAWATGGFILVSDTTAKGLYRLDLPNAAIASGNFVIINIEFDGIIEESIQIPLHTRKVNVTQWLGTAASTPTVAGVPNVNVKTWNDLTTVALPLIPTVAGRTLDVATTGEAGLDFANVLSAPAGFIAATFPTGTIANTTNITAGTIATITNTVTADVDTIKTQAVTCAAGVTINPSVGAATIQPTVTQFDARTLLAANYTVVGDLGVVQTGDSFALIGTAGVGLTNLGGSANNWNVGKTGYALSAIGADLILKNSTFGLAMAAACWQNIDAANFTVASSIGKSIMNGVALGTGLTVVSVSGAVGSVTGAVGSVTGHTNQSGDSFALIGTAGAGLTNVGASANNWSTHNAAAVYTAFGTGSNLTASGITAAAVNAEVVDCLNVDTYAEPGQETPAATNTIVKKLGYCFKNVRNKKDQDATMFQLYNDGATVVDQKATVADSGTVASKTELITGP